MLGWTPSVVHEALTFAVADEFGQTPAHLTAKKGDIEMLEVSSVVSMFTCEPVAE
jgi:hypothetical protein